MTFLPFSGALASGDGSAHVVLPTGEMLLMSENAQLGIISHRNGEEKLAISIRVAESDLESGTSAVWMFPVPASPGDVDISLIPSLRPFSGLSLGALAENTLSDHLALALMSQVYTIPLSLAILDDRISPARLMLPETGADSDETSLMIFQTVESQGVVAELVGTEDGTALEAYLSSKGMLIGQSELEIIDDYVGMDYSFVVSWIENTHYFLDAATGGVVYGDETFYTLGVRMDFPTDRIYYPMRLTSAYGERHVPMMIEVFGFVSPDDPRGYDIDVQHMVYGQIALPSGMESFAWDDDARMPYYEYTRVWVDVESSFLQDDIWMDSDTPIGADALVYTLEHPFTVALAIFVVSSVLAGVFAALLVFTPYRPRLERFALLSGLNFLSVFAIWLIMRSARVQRFLVRAPKEPEPPPEKGRYRDFVIVYSITFVVMMILVPAAFLLAAMP